MGESEFMIRSLLKGRRIGSLLLLPIGLVPLVGPGQPSAAHVASPRFEDWTMHHVVYSLTGTSQALEAARSDPRALFRWREVEQREIAKRQLRSFAEFPGRRGPRRFPSRSTPNTQRDWSINLGTTGTAPAMYPAKYTFDVTATPSCTNDFVVFPINAPGSATQANIVAFDNLYSGTAGGTGLCNRAPVANHDIGTAATVLWSYNVNKIGGSVPTSPVLSLDGTKVAFVESAAGNPAHFHVLAWNSGDGVGTNLQDALTPKAITTFSTTTPAAGNATDLALGISGTDTISSPFVDYGHDLAYVGNDAGVVYRIKNVFCTTAACVAGAAPSIDSTWGSAGAVTIGGTCTGTSSRLTGPVLDLVSLSLYVGCADGKLYSISQSGTVNSLVVGDGIAAKTNGAIVDAPLVDGVNRFVYAVSGSASNGANGVLVQAKTNLSSSVAVPVGAGNQCNMHSPTPNNAYFTSMTAAGALMYVAGVTAGGTVPQPCTAASNGTATVSLYGVTFAATGAMNTGTPADNFNLGPGAGYEFAPLTEFYNATTATDWLFFSAIQSGQTNLASANITSSFPSSFSALVTEGVGTSGMVVDNSANTTTFPQAASIYFNALQQNAACNNGTDGGGTSGCAVKLTQATLQ
jgi:hypothetical protein